MGSNLCEGDSGDPKALEELVSAGLCDPNTPNSGYFVEKLAVA